MSTLGSLSPDDKKRIDSYMDTAIDRLQQIDDIKGSMKDLTKKVAEELNLTPRDLNEAVKIAYKNQLAQKKESLSTVEDILNITGRG